MAKLILEAKTNSFIVNGLEFQKGVLTVNHSENGISINGMYANLSDITIDGEPVISSQDLRTWISENLFKSGGGDGTGSQNKGATYLGAEPLFNEDLNSDYPNATDRFIVVAPNIGSGMLYIKIIVDNQGWWFSLPASLAINNQ